MNKHNKRGSDIVIENLNEKFKDRLALLKEYQGLNSENPILFKKDIAAISVLIDGQENKNMFHIYNSKSISVAIEDIPNITSIRISSDIDLHNVNFLNCMENGVFNENLIPKNLEHFAYDGPIEKIPAFERFCNSGMGPSELNNLKTVYLPNIEQIQPAMFLEAISLTSIYAPKLNIISRSALGGCSNLKNVDFKEASKIETQGFAFSGLSSVSFPKVTYIGNDAFQECENIISADFPEALSAYSAAFSVCYKMRFINAPKLKYIGDACFAGCHNLLSVSFNNVNVIEHNTFLEGFKLSKIELNNVSTISDNAFTSCENLLSIYLPKLEITKGTKDDTDPKDDGVFSFTNNLSIYYRIPGSAEWLDDNDILYPDKLWGKTFSHMNGNWAFILSPSEYNQLVTDIKNDKNDPRVNAYKDYLNVDWIPGEPWGTNTNESKYNIEQHIITL